MTQVPSIKLDTFNHRVIVDSVSYGKRGDGPSEFQYPTSAVVAGDRAYVVDSWNHRVQVFDLPEWKFAFAFGGFFCPKWIEIVEDCGTALLLIVDTNNRRLTLHDTAGKLLSELATTSRRFPVMARTLRDTGSSPIGVEVTYEDGSIERLELDSLLRPKWWQTKLQKPVSLARDARGFIYVSDFGRRVVEKFDAEGDFISEVLGVEILNIPGKMAMNGNDLLVTDRPADAIHIYDTVRQISRKWDYPFQGPGVIGKDAEGNIWVAEYKLEADPKGATFSVFNPDYGFSGAMLLRECKQPTAIAISAGHIFVADQSARNVLVFELDGTFVRAVRPQPFASPVWSISLRGSDLTVATTPVVDLLWAADTKRLYYIDFETAVVTYSHDT